MEPSPNGQMPAMARNSVDLPAPEGPVISVRSPSRKVSASAATTGSPCGSRTRSCLSSIACAAGRNADRGGACREVPRACNRHLEAVETRDNGAPFGEPAVDRDEEGQRPVDFVEGVCRLLDAAELQLAGKKVGRRHQDIGKDHRCLRIALGEDGQTLGAAHDAVPVGDDAAEAAHQPLALGGLALHQRDLLGVLARAHQVETEIRLALLLLEVEIDQRRADPLRQHGAEYGIDQRAPDQVARNCKFMAEQLQRGCRRQAPQDHHEGQQCYDRVQQPEADVHRALDEQLDVLGHALVGVVGRIAQQLHAVVVGTFQPLAEIVAGSSSCASGSAAID